MLTSDIIRSKRDGAALGAEAIREFVTGIARDSVSDAQIAAFCMAVYLNGMNSEETGLLTREMATSGRVLAWQPEALGGPVIDKHSTGGVGDKVSLALAPIAAACGCFVPMVSGRGLGHSGGTLDKMDCIPGYRSTPDLETLRRVVADVGCAIIGQTADLAPADRRVYAVRDVTATVESLPLITASILSKKIAAGNEFLVMDVKFGSGAFMRDVDRARELARHLVDTATASGLGVRALLTDMDEPLGTTAGHWLELREIHDYLSGIHREARLHEVVMALAAEMLVVTGLADDRDGARAQAEGVLASGAARERFQRMVTALGGPWDFLDRFDHYYEAAPMTLDVPAPSAGYLAAIDAREVGMAIVELGGGRRRGDETLDGRVGFSGILPVGAAVNADRPLAYVHGATEAAARKAAARYAAACTIATTEPVAREVVAERLGAAR